MPKIPKTTVGMRHLKYFKELSTFKSFTITASRLGVSQSSISSTIKELEDSLGVSLFNRTTHYVELTYEGNLIKQHVDCIVNGHHNGISELYKAAKYSIQTIRIACTPSAVQHISSRLLAWTLDNPLIDLHIQDMDDSEVSTAVAVNSADLGIASHHDIATNLHISHIAQEEMIALVPMGHRFSSQKVIDLEDFSEERIAILKRDNFNSYIEKHFRTRNISVAQFIESEEIETIISLVAANYLIGLFFFSNHNLPSGSDFVARKINQNPISRKIYLIFKSNNSKSLASLIHRLGIISR